ncbi:hypothetical protein QUF76_04180 [Desulfobacterales bacterium HSG16]|nr:hypothetical protein [Desulfobacterales bacterium HSG16]
MKNRPGILIMACAMLLFYCLSNTHAADLKEEYRQLILKRQALEKIRRNYESKLRTLSSEGRVMSSKFYQCVSSNWKPIWRPKLDQAKLERKKMEVSRVKLNEIRKSIGAVRQKLEGRRMEIEKRYMGKGRGHDYETEFRQYMSDLDDTYFGRMKSQLFKGYDKYVEEVKNYISFLKSSADLCTGGTD